MEKEKEERVDCSTFSTELFNAPEAWLHRRRKSSHVRKLSSRCFKETVKVTVHPDNVIWKGQGTKSERWWECEKWEVALHVPICFRTFHTSEVILEQCFWKTFPNKKQKVLVGGNSWSRGGFLTMPYMAVCGGKSCELQLAGTGVEVVEANGLTTSTFLHFAPIKMQLLRHGVKFSVALVLGYHIRHPNFYTLQTLWNSIAP